MCVASRGFGVQVKDADGKMVMDYWETAKKMMNDSYFLDSLKFVSFNSLHGVLVMMPFQNLVCGPA